MAEPTTLKKGDRCPNCGGQLEEAPAPTARQRAAATNRENPVDLPPHYDSASDDQRAELGGLYRCARCGYRTRFPLESKSGAGKGRGAARGAAADVEKDETENGDSEQG